MQVFILPTNKIISPFDEGVSNCYIGNEILRDCQTRVFKSQGCKVFFPESIDNLTQQINDNCIITYDNVYLTKRVIKSFIKRAIKKSLPVKAALPESLFIKNYSDLQELEEVELEGDKYFAFNLFYFPFSKFKNIDSFSECSPLSVKYKEIDIKFPVPRAIMKTDYFEHPVSSSLIMHINHWVHILWANNLCIQVKLVEEVVEKKARTFWRLLKSFRFGKKSSFWAMAKNFNSIGKNCNIHPTACIEGSIIGDNVTIGAFTLVRASMIGENTVIEERANINFSVLGTGCFVSKNSTVVSCAGYPDADLCINGMQFCLVGKKAALTSLVRPLDTIPGGKITVMYKSKPVQLKAKVLGCCFGTGCFVGPDIFILPGREIPSGAFIIRDPNQVLSRVSKDIKAGEPSYIKNQVLVPLKKPE